MKMLLSIFFISTVSTMAANAASGPAYKVPRNASSSIYSCTITSSVSEKTADGWSAFQDDNSVSLVKSTNWSAGRTIYNLRQSDLFVHYNAFVQGKPRLDGVKTRKESREHWRLGTDGWEKDAFHQDVSIIRMAPQVNRFEETREGVTAHWEVAFTLGGGHGFVTRVARKALNPEALNTENRRFASFEETCVLQQ